MTTPRVKFCWHCGKKLQWGSKKKKFYFTTLTLPDGYERVLHKECAKNPDLVLTDSERLSATD